MKTIFRKNFEIEEITEDDFKEAKQITDGWNTCNSQHFISTISMEQMHGWPKVEDLEEFLKNVFTKL